MADIKTSDFPLLGSLKLTDRVVLTDQNTGHEIAVMTVDDFIDQTRNLKPIAWEYIAASIPSGGEWVVDLMSGLMTIQLLAIDSKPGIYYVNSWHQTLTFMVGFDVNAHPEVSISFDADRKVKVTNNTVYDSPCYISYQKVGALL